MAGEGRIGVADQRQRPGLTFDLNDRRRRSCRQLECQSFDHASVEGIAPCSVSHAGQADQPQVVGLVGLELQVCAKMKPGEKPHLETVRFRSLGCYPLTGAQVSKAANVPEIIEEMLRTTTSERQSRAIDAESAAAMENRKREGYF